MATESAGKHKIFQILFIIWCLIIIILSVVPSVESPFPEITIIDKIAHFSQYLVFSLFFYLMRINQQTPKKFIINELIILSFIIPILTELIQIPIPGRKFSLLDILANYIGFIVIIIYAIISSKKELRLNNEE